MNRFLASALLALATAAAQAGDVATYPDRPIRMLLPFSAGDGVGTDRASRTRLVLHHYRLLELRREAFGEQAAENVAAAAGGEGQ